MKALLVLSLAAVLQADVLVEDRMTKSAQVRAGGRMILSTDYGSVEVIPGGAGKIDVDVQRRVEAPSRERGEEILRDFDLEISSSADAVIVRGVFRNGWRPESEVGRRGRRICREGRCLEYAEFLKEHHFRVTVPKDLSVELKTSGGSIQVGDIGGSVRAATSGGSMRFGRIGGPIHARTSGGSITVTGATGAADIRTSGGSITIGETTGDIEAHTSGGSVTIERTSGKVLAHTSGGSVTVREAHGAVDASTSGGSISATILSQPKGPCNLQTSGGNVTITLADNIGVELDASTSGGRIHTDFPVTLTGKIDPRSIQSKINGGGPSLRARTSGGSIYVRRAGAA